MDPKRVAYCKPVAIADTEYKQAPMFHPRVLFRTLVPMLVPVLLLAGCIMPARQDATPVPPQVAEPVPEPSPEELTAVVNQNANVRTGPSTDHAVAYWLTAGAEVTVVGRNADGDWLQIEHEDRPGWIFTALIDITAEGMAELPPEEPTPAPVAAEPPPEPEPVVEPEPTVVPAPEPEPQVEAPERVTATVTGTVVNLRTGPGTNHPTDGQVRAGDRLAVTGRNADGSWLQVMHPVKVGEHIWIYGPLTDIDAAAVQTLTEVTTAEIEVATPPEPEPIVEAEPTPAPEPVVQPEPETPSVAVPTVPADCTRRHTVNPNETHLQVITDWFGLDLAATAALNGIAPDTPLTADTEICLSDAPTVAQPQPQPQPAAPAPQPAAGGVCQTPIGPQPCIQIPDFPERGHPNAPIGPFVESASPYVWHAPGTYARDLPGLDYDFELVFTDISVMWDWSVRDFEGCYDALRVHMGVVPQEFGLQRMELRLADAFISEEGDVNWKEFHWRENDIYFSPQAAVAVPWLEWPNWNPAALPHPDVAVVQYGCYLQPDESAMCDIVPWWGNSHSIHVNAAAARAMANTVMYMSRNALANRYRSRLHEHVLQANAYLYPLLDTRVGDPAGHGPCVDVWRAG